MDGRSPTSCATSKPRISASRSRTTSTACNRTPTRRLRSPRRRRCRAAIPAQYVVSKLRLPEVHKIATGNNVLVAMIDSQVDTAHPDLNGAFAGQFDAVGNHDKPDEHGTEMTGRHRRPPQASRHRAACPHPCDPCVQPGSACVRRRPRPSTSSPASNRAIAKGAKHHQHELRRTLRPRAVARAQEGARERDRTDRGGRQCGAGVPAPLSRGGRERDRGDGDRRKRQAAAAGQSGPVRRAGGSRRQRPGARARWHPMASPPARRSRPPMSAVSRR